ncbi:hypothetical protein NEMBOFW57_008174 [Staphylotrichum longicolle]|uniref:NmrA-like domain-containing protein n=1 Tax=Staphylotrichum longicolle TaxID=669026 RepID=A0AAD4ER70_9PEZI|nr:hypothetical protein NEMBOFW57_008174 [Staphylotrichum longicolle]
MAPNVLIFGATGGVGSFTTLAAHALGANITLAMRDTSKPIPNLPSSLSTSLPRVHADLTDPTSIHTAVTTSHATAAFIYCAFGAPDHMRGAITALKAAGVELVVFLSSSSIKGDVRAVPPSDFIPWQHAQVEIVLEEVFGPAGYVAVRPGYFASNLLVHAKRVAKGEVVTMPYPEAEFDYVVPGDIGRLVAQREVVRAMGKAVGKEVTIEGFTEEEDAVKFVVENLGLPELAAKQLVKGFRAVAEGLDVFEKTEYEEAVANIEKYGGKKATTVYEWVEENKDKFV